MRVVKEEGLGVLSDLARSLDVTAFDRVIAKTTFGLNKWQAKTPVRVVGLGEKQQS